MAVYLPGASVVRDGGFLGSAWRASGAGNVLFVRRSSPVVIAEEQRAVHVAQLKCRIHQRVRHTKGNKRWADRTNQNPLRSTALNNKSSDENVVAGADLCACLDVSEARGAGRHRYGRVLARDRTIEISRFGGDVGCARLQSGDEKVFPAGCRSS
jgi:hypothetical protein